MAASVRSEPGPKFDGATSRASGVPPDDSGNRTSGSVGNEYCYSPLSHGSIRLLRLMPHENEKAPIRCQLFKYPLREPGQGIHLYEALSYVWGSEENKEPIYVQPDDKSGGSCLLVTANLREALSYLRDRVLERVIWIDAICINQEDKDEKGQQVQSMAKIYANVSRVIVWFGKAADNSDQAIEALRRVVGERRAPPTIDEPTQQAILALLKRPWFQRIWVLQEVAAARYVLIKCGSLAIDGYIFCSGLDASELSYDKHPPLRNLIPPITRLIRDAVTRPQYETRLSDGNPPNSFSLNIRPLGELVDMFHTRKATNPLDRVYALLGMSSDDPRTAGLSADYTASWAEVFRKLVQFSLSDQMSVDTSNEPEKLRAIAVVRGKGHILGRVSSVDSRGDAHSISIVWKNSLGSFDISPRKITLRHSAQPILQGDAVCLLQGASKPTIVRPRDCYSAIIIIAAPLAETDSEWSVRIRSITTSLTDFVLIWDWDASQHEPQDRNYESFISGPAGAQRPWTELQDYLDKATRLWNFGVLFNEMGRYGDAGENLQKAVEVYATALRSIGDHPGHSAWIEADGETLGVIHNLVIGAANDAKSFNDQTPLVWAAKNGHKAAVKLLLDKGPAIETQDSEYLRTPLSWVAGNGDEALVKLLLDKGMATETKDNFGRTPLHWAAMNGHEAVVRLLAELGADKEARDGDGRTPLHLAAENGHEAVARLLAAELGADKEVRDGDRRTPLHLAAENGHEAVARLLAVELGVDKEAKSGGWHEGHEWTPLHRAAENGHEVVVKRLLDKGAIIETKDFIGRTPLHLAAENGHEAVARLLVELGADKKAKDNLFGRTPLHLAAKNGHEAVARLLVELGADKNAKDNLDGRTPLHLAAKNGHKAVARLLVEAGADKEAKDHDGHTPLRLAAKNGHGALARLYN